MKALFEKVDIDKGEGIHAFQFEQDYFDMPYHFHPEYELTLILESSGMRYVGNNISDFETGDLVLLGSSLPHCWKNEKDHQGTSRSIVIQWSPELIHDTPLFTPIRSLLQKAQKGLKLPNDGDDTVPHLMREIVRSTGINRYLGLVQALSHLASMDNLTYIAGESYSYDLSSSTTTRLEKVQSYVRDHFNEKIKLAEVASNLHMTEQAFSRFFSKAMKKPFFLFLNEYRVNRASRLIFETDLQMNEIAYKCGYESLPFFYKQFKKFKGYTPLEFRKMYRHARK
ncbi:MAG: AraC family transcriptional regulator [Bacteroidota bacterium]